MITNQSLIEITNTMKYILPLLILLSVTACSPSVQQTTYRSVIEITATNDSLISADSLIKICARYTIAPDSIYQWKNHLVVYGALTDSVSSALQRELQTAYTDATVQCYPTPFYIFDRRRHANEKETTNAWDKGINNAWDHIIMTANLVDTPALQQEYLDYHATQYEKFPEVANGFCKADFQQVLVFRNGRQLLLVISIPKGEDLDKLNPKTTEDNPRVDDWNAIMSKYQEGIPGTKPEETWVVLQPIKNR